jgi:hypothetical protein
LSTTIVFFSNPKLLLFSVQTFIKWRLTPSYAAKDTIFWQKRPKTIIIGIIVQDNKNLNLFIWLSMWTHLEHTHCLETINNMWFLGKRESVNACKKADFDGFREKDTDSEKKMDRSEVSSKWNKCWIYVGDQLDRWNELKEMLRVQIQSFFIFYEFMMLPRSILSNKCNLAPGNSKLLSMNSIKRPYLRGKQTRILTSMLQHPGYWHNNR